MSLIFLHNCCANFAQPFCKKCANFRAMKYFASFLQNFCSAILCLLRVCTFVASAVLGFAQFLLLLCLSLSSGLAIVLGGASNTSHFEIVCSISSTIFAVWWISAQHLTVVVYKNRIQIKLTWKIQAFSLQNLNLYVENLTVEVLPKRLLVACLEALRRTPDKALYTPWNLARHRGTTFVTPSNCIRVRVTVGLLPTRLIPASVRDVLLDWGRKCALNVGVEKIGKNCLCVS